MAAFMLSPAADQRAEGPLARFWVHLGDASYALYLIHPFVIVSLRKVWVATGAHQAFGFWPMVALALVLSIAAALLAYRLIEKPVTRALNAALLQPSLPSAGNASSR